MEEPSGFFLGAAAVVLVPLPARATMMAFFAIAPA
jgi:hypothetical protein